MGGNAGIFLLFIFVFKVLDGVSEDVCIGLRLGIVDSTDGAVDVWFWCDGAGAIEDAGVVVGLNNSRHVRNLLKIINMMIEFDYLNYLKLSSN